MKQTHLLFLLTVWFTAALANAFQASGYGEGAAEYLKLPVHAQSASLEGAVTAWRQELAGLQFNPAVLEAADTLSYSLMGSYSFMTLDRKHLAINIAGSIGSYLALGLSFVNHGVENIEGRDSMGFSTDNFEYQENALAVSVAGRLKWNISLGASVRYLFESMEKERANGVGFDLGATYQPLPQLCIGVSGLNIGSRLWWSTGHDDPVLPEARIGVAGILLDEDLIIEGDIIKCLRQPLAGSFGVQYTLFHILSLRGGISSSVDIKDRDSKKPDFSLGIGMRYSFVGFDYALHVPSSELGVSHKVSIIVKIPTLF